MWRYTFVLATGLIAASVAPAATWADSMFDSLNKDFGSVTRGQTQKHRFRVKNNTKGNVQIASLRVSCGCVTAKAGSGFLRPGEETAVVASMDTSRFIGPRTVTVFVQFSSPAFEEVRLWVSANSRSDFLVSPETLSVGQVKRAAGGSGSVTVTFYGNRLASITKARAESNYVKPVVTEIRRMDHEVAYTLSASIRKDTPVGKWYTDVWLETNVAGLPQIRVPLTVEVESPLTVNPPQLVIDSMKAGSEADKRVLVRGVAPFKIKEIKGLGKDIKADFRDEARETHIVNLKVKPGKAGKLDRLLKVVTDMKEDNVIDFRIEANVIE